MRATDVHGVVDFSLKGGNSYGKAEGSAQLHGLFEKQKQKPKNEREGSHVKFILYLWRVRKSDHYDVINMLYLIEKTEKQLVT